MILLIVAVLVSLFYYNQRSRVERRMPEKIRKQVMSDARPMPPQPVMSITKEELEEWFPYLRGKE